MIELREYQNIIVDRVREHIKGGVKSILIQLPTGGGKTALMAKMIGNAMRREYTGWFVVHRRELIRQCIRTFNDVGIPHGIVSSGSYMDRKKLVQIASVQTLVRRLDRLPPPQMIAWDEAHHLAAGSWSGVYSRYPDCIHIGLSATPLRLDGSGLAPYFQQIVCGPATRWLIDNGYLSEFTLFSIPSVSMEGVHHMAGDFKKSEVIERLEKSTVTGDVVSHYIKYAMGRRAIVFEASIERSQRVAQSFMAAGIPALHIDGKTDDTIRDRALSDLEAGVLKVLCNVDLFGEGVDVPAVEAIHLCRPTDSLTLYLQQIGRGLRPAPGKDRCLIFDHAGNYERHGPPDEEREWKLEYDKDKRKRGDTVYMDRRCPACFAIAKAGAIVCFECGKAIPVNSREIQDVAGELQEVDLSLMRHQAKVEQGMSRNMDSLIQLAKMRGYRNPKGWAEHVLAGREKKKSGRARI